MSFFDRFEGILLTDELLLDYKRCKRRGFLNIHGDSTKQDPGQDFLLKLRQDSRTHKQGVLANTVYQRPNYHWGDWEAGSQATWELMQQGTECIVGGVLLRQLSERVTLLSCPDLLEKQPGQSVFGDWMYLPTSIKLGKRPKPEYKILAAFHAKLLASVQEAWPSKAWLVLRRPHPYPVHLDKWVPLMEEALSGCIQMLLQRHEPEVFISRQKCSLCRWYSSCYAIAQSTKHISLLPGVTPTRYEDLQGLGIMTVESLAQSTIGNLEPVFEIKVASELLQQARSTVQGRAILRQASYTATISTESTNGKKPETLNEDEEVLLPTASIEFYFDIEAEPELNVDYLLGVLVIDRLNHTEVFYPFLAEHPRDEALIWQNFLTLAELYPNAPIFHFADYEAETVRRLGSLYNTPPEQVKQLLSRFVDVHELVMDNVKLPVESYSLKHLARWLGFEWRDASMTGSQTVCLYDQWLETGDRSLLDAVERYNEDDCRATYKLKDWLAKFLEEAVQS
ncbi:TM0106 family RecB-like putative nuclease [Lyngbya aestuarii]|uniref:TM0106 family RecB-like putative nuclease n=1 Tax=Lyngbya aestuarii TaxID=118322 RepID=UPI00403DB102